MNKELSPTELEDARKISEKITSDVLWVNTTRDETESILCEIPEVFSKDIVSLLAYGESLFKPEVGKVNINQLKAFKLKLNEMLWTQMTWETEVKLPPSKFHLELLKQVDTILEWFPNSSSQESCYRILRILKLNFDWNITNIDTIPEFQLLESNTKGLDSSSDMMLQLIESQIDALSNIWQDSFKALWQIWEDWLLKNTRTQSHLLLSVQQSLLCFQSLVQKWWSTQADYDLFVNLIGDFKKICMWLDNPKIRTTLLKPFFDKDTLHQNNEWWARYTVKNLNIPLRWLVGIRIKIWTILKTAQEISESWRTDEQKRWSLKELTETLEWYLDYYKGDISSQEHTYISRILLENPEVVLSDKEILRRNISVIQWVWTSFEPISISDTIVDHFMKLQWYDSPALQANQESPKTLAWSAEIIDVWDMFMLQSWRKQKWKKKWSVVNRLKWTLSWVKNLFKRGDTQNPLTIKEAA